VPARPLRHKAEGARWAWSSVFSADAQVCTSWTAFAVEAEGGRVTSLVVAGLGRQRYWSDAARLSTPPTIARHVSQLLVHLVTAVGAWVFDRLALTGRAESHDSLQKRSRQKRRARWNLSFF